MEIPEGPITLKQNVGVYAIDINCNLHSQENSKCAFCREESVDQKISVLFYFLAGHEKLPLLLSTQVHRLKKSLKSLYFQKWPIFSILISLIEIIFFCTSNERFKRLLVYDADHKVEIWRFFTYMLVHTDSIHLILNIIIQGFLGISLELEQSRSNCAAVYIGGCLGGSLGASAFSDVSLMAGASGGIYALLFSQIPNTVLNYEDIKYAMQRVVTVVALTTADVAYVFYHVYFHNNESPRIGWVAHASGAVTGLLLGFLIFKGSSDWKRRLQTISLVLLFLLFVLGVISITSSDYFMVLIS